MEIFIGSKNKNFFKKNNPNRAAPPGRKGGKNMGRKSLLITAVVLLFLATPLLPQTGNPDLEAELEIQEIIKDGKTVKMKFTLHNRTNESLQVLTWFTPFEGVAGEIFDVKRDGADVTYHGILVKRGAPQPEDYISIEAGKSMSAEVDLAKSYDFKKAGDYGIEFRSPAVSHVVKKDAPKAKSMAELLTAKKVEIPSNKVTVKIEESIEPPAAAAADESEVAAKVVFTNCSSSEQTTVQNTNNAAMLWSAVVYGYFNGLSTADRSTDALYKTWFGAYTAARYATVLSNWNNIKIEFENANITYNCHGPACQSSWYAYVYKGGKVEVFLCPQFWSAPDSGTDSKPGVLIHEISHEVADTDDWAYGQTACKILARTDPAKAIDNADNYEYCAEE
jgi:peptidyl-Lys metalloendopeptidase